MSIVDLQVQQETKGICAGFGLTSLVLVLALSMHAVFEGIALGLTKDYSATLNIMLALLCHKVAASMSLGSSITKNFVENDEKRKGIFLLLIFAFATPCGIIIGLLLQEMDNSLIEVAFNSFAGGTFIYIAASEVIVEEFSMPGRYKWVQYFTFLCGIAIITALWLLEGDEDD